MCEAFLQAPHPIYNAHSRQNASLKRKRALGAGSLLILKDSYKNERYFPYHLQEIIGMEICDL